MKELCKGQHCPVKKNCRRYVEAVQAEGAGIVGERVMNHCTNQKKFVKV